MSSNNLNINYKSKNIKENIKDSLNNSNNQIKLYSNNNVNKKEEHTKVDLNTFEITAIDLENLMGKYKERGTDFKDLKYFEEEKSVSQLIEELKTNIETGLDNFDGREEAFGSNKVFVEPVPPFCSYVWEALKDLMVRILIIAAIVSIVLGCTFSDDPSKDWIDGVSIVVAVLVVVLVGSITDYQKEQKFHELNEVQAEGTKYKLIRKGQPEDHISDDLLVGDLIMINYGDIMPADVLLIEGNGIKMDESALTGESDAMKKEKYEKCKELLDKGETKLPSPLILSGTNCIEGSGKGIVIAVGDHSQKGLIRRTVDNAQENSQTPLEAKLETIAQLIGYFGIGAGIVTLIALMIRFGISFSKETKEYQKTSKVESVMTGIIFNLPYKADDEGVVNNIDNELVDPRLNVAKKILDIIILCISIVVVAIPEGLPLAVTLSLAFSIKKMMDYNNLVRKMHACETMGGANYICTDKTGTLTKNEMSVFQILTGTWKKELVQNLEIEDVGKLDKKDNNNEVKQIREDYKTLFKNDKYWETLKVAVALNVDASIKKLERENINGDLEICETKNKTDKAFIDFLYRFRAPISVEKEKYLKDESSYKQFPFDSKKKRMTTFVKNSSFPTGYRLLTKGGGENARLFCKHYLDPDSGEKKPLDDSISMQIKQSIEEFNKDKLRSLYIAYKDINENQYKNCEQVDKDNKLIDQDDLVFLAVFGIKDSLRDGVKEAVRKCHEASVNVIMVTGDNIVTATAIAKDCGILGEEVDLKNLGPQDIENDPELINNPSKKEEYIQSLVENKPRALTGNSFYNSVGGLICDVCKEETNLCKCPKTESEAIQIAEKTGTEPKPVKKDVIKNMDNFKSITERLKVMARSQPMHKYALVLGLKALKNVVAVTGDGTNDAPALSKSDVGFAMFAGTDIAKEASDIVIIDNNFSSIVTAIIYGRNIYDNIRKFLQFQLSVNFCACILVFVCACIGNETPLTPIQMLWVNLIMDSLGSLALATEPPYEELLQREPTKRNESMINGRMWKHIVFQSIFQIILLVILYLIAPEFIKEQNMIRLAENRIIKYCYGKFPGKDEDHIIYGTEIKWPTDVKLINSKKEFCGKYSSRQFLSEAYTEYVNSNCATTHMCLIFNIFVFYTLFNQINCRVIDDSFNIFVRMNRSLLFPLICFLEMGLQVAIIFIGKSPFHIVNEGLTGVQWGICIGFSAITFVVSFIMKLIPLQIIIDKWLKTEEKDIDIDEDLKIIPPSDSVEKFEINKRKSKRHGSNRIINRDSNKKFTITSRISSSKNLNVYS
ncbi:MAG: cation-translocating P-type ATPase [Bacilli bacterium]|nr:cation-translocating P-type ATPase [Bacilli bacterium]